MEVPCPDFSLESTSGTTLDEIRIGELPSSFEKPFAAAMLGSDEEPVGFADVREDDAGSLLLSVPLHPTEPLAGGPVRFALTDGVRACPVVTFTISPLPQADGELEAVVDLLQARLAEQAAVHGATIEELQSTPVLDMDPSLWPLAMGQVLLDDPSNDESLRTIADGVLGTEALDWLDRLLARTELRTNLESPPAPSPRIRGVGPGRSVEGLFCRPEFVETGDQLDFCMEKAAEIAASVTGLSREVSEDIKQVFSDLNSNGLPLAGEVQAVFGAMFWVIYSEREQAASLLPSSFTAMEAVAEPDRIFEDDDVVGSLSADVYATSLGYNLQQQIIDGIKEAAGLVDATGKFEISTGTKLDAVAAKLAPKFEQRIRDVDIDELDIPAELFGPVHLGGGTLLDARIVTGQSVALVGDLGYEGRARGPTTLSVRTADGHFGGSQIADQLDVEVVAVQVAISPTDVTLAADAVKTFDVTVSNSKHPDAVELINTESLQGSAELTIGQGGSHYITYVAPVTPNVNNPDLLTVRHTAETGARGYSSEERLATATVRFGGIQITTDPGCVEPGAAPIHFQATVAGVGDPDLVWTASAGSFGDAGEYTPPSEAGIVTITVALASNPDVKDSIEIQVGGCSCQATIVLDGTSAPTNSLSFYLTQDLSAVLSFQWTGPLSTASFGFGSDPGSPEPVPIGTTGEFEAIGSGIIDGVGNFGNPDDFNNPTISPLTAIISDNTGDLFAGVVSGQVALATQTEDRIVPFSLTFSIEADPVLSQPTAKVCSIE